MKKFLTICGIVAGGMLLVGIILLTTVFFVKGKAFITSAADQTSGSFLDIPKIISNVTDSFLFRFLQSDSDAPAFSDIEKQPLSYSFDNLELSLGGCVFSVEPSPDDKFYLTAENLDLLTIHESASTLELSAKKNASVGINSQQVVILYIPVSHSFKKISVEFGAGKMSFDKLSADHVEIEVGAGEVDIANASVTNLECKVGAGGFSYQGSIQGDIDAQCTMGNISLQLDGSESDYDYDLDCSMGSITVGSQRYTSHKKIENHHSLREIHATCSMGNIEISF